MYGIGHKIGDTFRGAVNFFSTTSTTSQFIEKGMLTPEEFIEAGDQLVFKFPTWQWQSSPEANAVPYLPRDKQYLITRNVPCAKRVKDLDEAMGRNRQEGEWTLPEQACPGAEASKTSADPIPEMTGGCQSSSSQDGQGGIGGLEIKDDFIQEAKDMDFATVDDLLIDNDPAKNQGDTYDYVIAEAPPDDSKSRTYDLHISYDKYYQTPRLWLSGYSNGIPLKPEEVFEDILSAYSAKTVTIDPHPHTRMPTASIHPCKHAQVMKKVVDDWIAEGLAPRVDLAMFVFLKFISSIVPTINYDFTMDIEF